MNHPEDQLQRQILALCKLHPPLGQLVYHVPNGGRRNAIEAARLKSAGVRAGVSDLHIPLPILNRPLEGSESTGLWIEVKAPGKHRRPTMAQSHWLDLMRSHGAEAHVIDRLEDAQALLADYQRRWRATQ